MRKTFLTSGRGEAEREWFALGHLTRYADGLAPRPLTSGLTDRPAWITMTRVPGATPDRWNDADREAVAQAIERLWSVPTAGLPEQHGSPAFAPLFWRRLLENSPVPPPGQFRETHLAAKRWLDSVSIDRLLDDRVGRNPLDQVVFGQGDPNVTTFSSITDRRDWSTSRTPDAAGRSSSWPT